MYLVNFNSVYNVTYLKKIKWHHCGRKKLQTCPVVIKTYYVFVDAAGKEEKKFKNLSINFLRTSTKLL